LIYPEITNSMRLPGFPGCQHPAMFYLRTPSFSTKPDLGWTSGSPPPFCRNITNDYGVTNKVPRNKDIQHGLFQTVRLTAVHCWVCT